MDGRRKEGDRGREGGDWLDQWLVEGWKETGEGGGWWLARSVDG